MGSFMVSQRVSVLARYSESSSGTASSGEVNTTTHNTYWLHALR